MLPCSKKRWLLVDDLSLETWQTFYGRIYKVLLEHPYDTMYTVDEIVDSLKRNGFIVSHFKKKYKKIAPFFFVNAIKQ